MTVETLVMFGWILIIVIAFIIEVNTLDLVSIWFSLGAIAAFIASLVGLEFEIQIWIFIVTTVVLLALTRPLAKKYMVKNTVKTNADRLIGRTAKITKVITPGERGEVKIEGKYWLAFSKDNHTFELDEPCTVLAIEGVKLLVGKIE